MLMSASQVKDKHGWAALLFQIRVTFFFVKEHFFFCKEEKFYPKFPGFRPREISRLPSLPSPLNKKNNKIPLFFIFIFVFLLISFYFHLTRTVLHSFCGEWGWREMDSLKLVFILAFFSFETPPCK